MAEIAEVVLEENVDGMIISNTTIARPPTLKTTDQTLVNECGRVGTLKVHEFLIWHIIHIDLIWVARRTQWTTSLRSLHGSCVPNVQTNGGRSSNYCSKNEKNKHLSYLLLLSRAEGYPQEKMLWIKLKPERAPFRSILQWSVISCLNVSA